MKITKQLLTEIIEEEVTGIFEGRGNPPRVVSSLEDLQKAITDGHIKIILSTHRARRGSPHWGASIEHPTSIDPNKKKLAYAPGSTPQAALAAAWKILEGKLK